MTLLRTHATTSVNNRRKRTASELDQISSVDFIGQNESRLSRILIWSSTYDVANGQAIVTRHVVRSQTRVVWHKAIYAAGGGWAMATVVTAAFRLWFAAITKRPLTTYVVCSRSRVGFLRDLPALLLACFGIRTVVHVHGSDIVDLLTHGTLSGLARRLYRRCVLIVPSAHLVEALADFRFRSVCLCENFLPDVAPRAAPPHLRSNDGLLVVWNSNIIATKGFFDVVEGVRCAIALDIPVRLIAVGAPMADSEMSRREVELRLNNLHYEPWFEYLGSVSPEVASALVAASDVVALPSRYASECQPLALIQAMCLGKQLLITDTPALRATVRDYPSHIISEANPKAVAQVIAQALCQSKQCAQARDLAARAAQERFSTCRFDQRMEQILLGSGNNAL